MLQQYHWITGWWQPKCERPLSFVEDDKLQPGEDVTSGSQRTERTLKISFKISKCAISKNAQDGRPDRYWKLKKRTKECKKDPPPPRNENVRDVITQKEGERIRNSAIWQQKDRVLAEKCQMRPLCPEDEEWCQRQEAYDRHRTVTVYFIGAYPHLFWLFIAYLDNVWPTRSSF